MRSSAGSGKTNSPSRRDHRAAVPARDDVGHDLGAVEPAGLDQRHERRRGVLVDLDERVLVLDGLEVGVRADRGLGRDDAHAPVARGQRGRRGARPDDAEDGHVVAPRRSRGPPPMTVLQATTMAFTSRATSWSRHSWRSGRPPRRAAARTARARCRRGRRCSPGSRRRTSRSTVSPPTPESKKPIGRRSATSAPRSGGAARPARAGSSAAAMAPMSGLIRAVGIGEHEGHALIVRLDNQPSIGDDARTPAPARALDRAAVRCRRSNPSG